MPDKFAMYLVVPSFRFYVGLGRLVMKEVDVVASYRTTSYLA